MDNTTRIMSVIIGVLLIAFYIFLYRKAGSDEMNGTCESSWWLKFLAIIGCIPLVLGVIFIFGFGYMANSSTMGMMLAIPVVFMMLCLAFYVFLYKKASDDDQNRTCNSSWWVKCLAIIGGIMAVMKVIGGLFGVGENYSINYNYTKTY